jgi:hypothetical protein
MQAPYRHDMCRLKFPGTAAANNCSNEDNPSLNVDILAEALDKHPDLRDAVVLAIQQLAAAITTTDSQKEPVTNKEE